MSPPMYDVARPAGGPQVPQPGPPYLVAYPVSSIPLGSPINDTMQRETSPFEKLSETNLYIRGLSADTTDLDLQKMCEKFGTIVSTKAIIDNETNKCKGYGFVDFAMGS